MQALIANKLEASHMIQHLQLNCNYSTSAGSPTLNMGICRASSSCVVQISLDDFNEIFDAKLEAHAPWERKEILQVQPAPAWEHPDAQKCYDRAQWILFLLRKAHMQPSPTAAAEALISAGRFLT